MKKLLLIAAVFALAAGAAFGVASQNLIASGAADLTGTDDGTTDGAILYASFQVCGVSYQITTNDEWQVGQSGIAGECVMPSEVVIQNATNNFSIQNTGGLAIDLGFEITDQDDADLWTMTGAAIGTAPAVIDQYTLALIVCNPGAVDPVAGDFGNEDILVVDETDIVIANFYDASAGDFQPAASAVAVYAHEGTNSLNLWAGPDGTDDIVDVHLYFQMSSAGASDAAVHTATIGVGGRITTG
ncbi:hypothetical protein DRQ36_10415 [bacterium]|nr:MAG: hypothetical protein DRQ36_10415 [bacterium]